MKSLSTSLLLLPLLISSTAKAATLLSQNFDADPVNYAGSAFQVQLSEPTRYFAISNFPDISLNPGITGATGNYIAAQNLNNDGDGTFNYDGATGNSPFVDFNPIATGWTDLSLTISLAAMPSGESINYIRADLDLDGDTVYETPVFNFQGLDTPNNQPFINILPEGGTLTANFETFTFLLPTLTTGALNLRIQTFTDTNSQNEATGFDTILITGTAPVPEPGTSLSLLLLGMLGLRRRR